MMFKTDPSIFRHPLEDRIRLVEANQEWLSLELEKEIPNEKSVIEYIRWCLWWAGLYSRNPRHIPVLRWNTHGEKILNEN